jgi:hypothetical protein
MESGSDVVRVLIKRTAFLEHDGIRLQEWNPEQEAVKKIGDVCVRLDRRIYFIYLGIAKTDDFHAARRTHHIEWCRLAEITLKEYFKQAAGQHSAT